MSRSEHNLRQDKAMRNAARALLSADVDHLKSELSGTGIASRAADRVKEGAQQSFEDAAILARQHKISLAALAGLAALWAFRGPIGALLGSGNGASDEPGEAFPDDAG